MKTTIRWIGLCAAAALAACAAPPEVQDVNQVMGARTPSGSAFTQALFQEYQALTKQQAKTEVEWVDAGGTARKALKVAAGEEVAPYELNRFALPASAVPALTAARARLMGYFADGAKTRVPAAAAKMQVAFDCWMEQEAQNNPKTCRSVFLTHEPMLKTASAATVRPPEANRRFVVNFDLGSAVLTAEAEKILQDAAADQARMVAPMVNVAGFTDTVGSPEANLRLANERAAAVAAKLTVLGVNPAIISRQALGESKLAVATGNDTAEKGNRRVEITLNGPAWTHGGYGGYAYGGRNCGWGGRSGCDGGGAYAVFFNVGSSALGPHATERLKMIVAAQMSMKPKSVRVVGYTDQTGSAAANEVLAQKRAQAVADAMAQMGGSVDAVEARPGENWGGASDGRGRRVEILFEY